MKLRWLALALVIACGDDDGGADAATDASADGGEDAAFVLTEEPGCDVLVPSVCAFPFPSMRFLETDEST
ncbi:MAG: hypothetical protein AAGE52_39585, partial [Myxococcota bacterium]